MKSLGVDDSKNLNDSKIRQIAPLLEEKIPHKALLLSPRKYNEVVGDGKAHNAVSVKVALHNQAIFLLLQSGAKPDKIVIDAFISEKNYQKYLKNERNHFEFPITLEEKAEGKYLAVAVSSIIARNLFLEIWINSAKRWVTPFLQVLVPSQTRSLLNSFKLMETRLSRLLLNIILPILKSLPTLKINLKGLNYAKQMDPIFPHFSS